MATFLTIGYGDAGGYEATDPARRDKAHVHDRWLASQGAVIAAVGPPTQVRNPEGGELEHDAWRIHARRPSPRGFRVAGSREPR